MDRPGRPAHPPERRRRNRVALRLTDAELRRLEAAAARRDQPLAQFARGALLRALGLLPEEGRR